MTVHTWTSYQATVTYDDSTRTFSVTGTETDGYSSIDDVPWKSYLSQAERIDINDPNLTLGSRCFQASTPNLQDAIINCKAIGLRTFEYCGSEYAQLDVTCDSISQYSFYESVWDVVSIRPRGSIATPTIGVSAFQYARAQTSLVIDMNQTKMQIKDQAFYGMSVPSIRIRRIWNWNRSPMTNLYIGDYAFYNTLTQRIDLPKIDWTTATIGEDAFAFADYPLLDCTVYSPSNNANGHLDAYSHQGATRFTYLPSSWDVLFTQSPSAYGTVSPAGMTVSPNQAVTISDNIITVGSSTVTATPSDVRYAFQSWSNAPSTITADVTITANFNLKQLRITFVSSNPDYGSVSLYGTTENYYDVFYGTQLTIRDNQVVLGPPYIQMRWRATATPTPSTEQETYQFDHWENVPQTVTESITMTAVFTRTDLTHTYTIVANNPEYGSVDIGEISRITDGSTYSVNGNKLIIRDSSTGAETTCTATQSPRTQQYTYTFDHWENLPDTKYIYDSRIITAVFLRTVNKYSLKLGSVDNVNLETVAKMGKIEYDGQSAEELTINVDYGTVCRVDSVGSINLIIGQNTARAVKSTSNTVSFVQWEDSEGTAIPTSGITIVGDTDLSQRFFGVVLTALDYNQEKTVIKPNTTNYFETDDIWPSPTDWGGTFRWYIYNPPSETEVTQDQAYDDYYLSFALNVDDHLAKLTAKQFSDRYYLRIQGRKYDWDENSEYISAMHPISIANLIVIRFFWERGRPYNFGNEAGEYMGDYTYVDKIEDGEGNIRYEWVSRNAEAGVPAYPPDPAMQGYIFGGWYDLNGKQVSQESPPHYTTYCTATFTKKYVPADMDLIYIQQFNRDGDRLLKQIDVGLISDMSIKYTPKATPTATPTMTSANTFVIDLQVDCTTTFSFKRKNPQIVNDDSDRSELWSNAKWLTEFRALVDRWQSETDGIKILYLPRGFTVNTIQTKDTIRFGYGDNQKMFGYIYDNDDNLGLIYGDNNEYKLVGYNAIITSYSDTYTTESPRIVSVSIGVTLGGMLSNYTPYRTIL